MKKNSAFTLRSGNRPSIAKLAGVSPVKNKFTGPTKPMVDKDKDGIPDFVDSDAGDGTKNKNKEMNPQSKKKTQKGKPKKGSEVQEIIQIDPTIKPPMGLDR